jgi:hypothetical protein
MYFVSSSCCNTILVALDGVIQLGKVHSIQKDRVMEMKKWSSKLKRVIKEQSGEREKVPTLQ